MNETFSIPSDDLAWVSRPDDARPVRGELSVRKTAVQTELDALRAENAGLRARLESCTCA